MGLKTFLIAVGLVLIALIATSYFYRAKLLRNSPSPLPSTFETTDNTSLRGGSIQIQIYCIEKSQKTPCKGGVIIKDKIKSDQPILRTTDESGNVIFGFEVGNYLLEASPPQDPKYKILQVTPKEITLEQGRTVNVQVTYSTE